MSSWVSSLKKYHTENNLKYKIPKKGSEEYEVILKYHNSIKGNGVSSDVVLEKPKKVKKEKVVKDEVIKKDKVKKEKVIKPKKEKKQKVVSTQDDEVELVQEDSE